MEFIQRIIVILPKPTDITYNLHIQSVPNFDSLHHLQQQQKKQLILKIEKCHFMPGVCFIGKLNIITHGCHQKNQGGFRKNKRQKHNLICNDYKQNRPFCVFCNISKTKILITNFQTKLSNSVDVYIFKVYLLKD